MTGGDRPIRLDRRPGVDSRFGQLAPPAGRPLPGSQDHDVDHHHMQAQSSSSVPARWTSPLEVTVSVDTGLNHHHEGPSAVTRGRHVDPRSQSSSSSAAISGGATASTSQRILDHQQGILALAIPASTNAISGRGLRHVTFGATTTSAEALGRPAVHQDGRHEEQLDKQQRRFARSFSYTPDLDSPPPPPPPPAGRFAAPADGEHVIGDISCLLPPRSFRDNALEEEKQDINNVQQQQQLGLPRPPPPPIKYQNRSSINQRADRHDHEDPEEQFVDGNYFFSQLDEQRRRKAEAEAEFEQLRRRRQIKTTNSTMSQGRDDLRRRQWRRHNMGHDHDDGDRLSMSLPTDNYFQYDPTLAPNSSRSVQRLKSGEFAGGMEVEIPIRWPTTVQQGRGRHRGGRSSVPGLELRQSISADRLQRSPPGRRQILNTKDYYYSSQPAAVRLTPVLTDISATEGRYHVGTGHFVHQFRPIATGHSQQLLNRTWTTDYDHQGRSARGQPDDRLSMSLDQGRFRRRVMDDDDEDDRRLRRLHLASSASMELDRQSDDISLAVNRDESLGSTTDPKVSPTGRKAVSWRDQEPNHHHHQQQSGLLHETKSTSVANLHHQSDDDDAHNDAESNLKDVRFETPLQAVSPQSYQDTSLTRSLQGSVSQMENIDQFALFEVSTSFLGWGESFMGTSWIDTIKQYKFVVLNRYEEVLFFGIEEDSSLSNCNLGPHKSSFKVRILDANGRDVIQFRRLYPFKPATKLSLGTKRKYRLEVSTSSGRVIGNVEKTFDSDSYYVLEDRAGECLFVVQRSCICTCPLFWDYEFKVLIPGTDTEVGEISWSYLTAHEEHFNGTEISFPVELESTSKIMLLGVCFLLNFSRWQSSYLESVYNPRKRGNRNKSSPTSDRSSARKVVHNSVSSPTEWRAADQSTRSAASVINNDQDDDDNVDAVHPVQQNQINRQKLNHPS